MAYGLRYNCTFTNDIQQDVNIQILLKDFVGDPEDYQSRELELSDSSDDNTIIARECRLVIWANEVSPITWETFLTGAYDEWYLKVIIDSYPHFEGFLTPEEGNTPFLDKPYSVTVRASNALKLLKDVPLTKLDGTDFHGKFTASDFIIAALSKTQLTLPVRMFGSLYNEGMDTRDDDPAATHWNQIKFDHRSFLKDATTFISCYDALVFLFGRSFRLFYFNGYWVVFFIHEHQYAPGGLWYTDFDTTGAVTGGGQDTTGYATVGKADAIFPIKKDGLLSSSFPIKFARTNFNYIQYPEFPLNSKFSRGTFITSGIDADGNIYRDYTIDDWVSATYQGNPTEFTNLPAQTVANPDPWYRRSTYNIYGVELRREVIIERATAAGGRYVQSAGEPVNAGDKIRISFDWKTDTDLGEGDAVPVQLTPYFVADGTGTKYVLRSKDGQVSEAKWEPAGSQMIGIYTTPNGELTDYQAISVESPTFPFNGTLYFMMWSSVQLGNNTKTFYKGFSVEYIPYIAGGYIPISGDYWKHEQNPNQIDKDEGDIKISDLPIRVMQGCMLASDGITATTPTWARFGVQESRHYKEIVNLARYNLGYRRFWQLEGTFKGVLYEAVNAPTVLAPISYHKTYMLADPVQPRFMILVPSLTIDLCKGHIKATFEEVYNPALTTNYGTDIYRVVNALIDLIVTEVPGAVLSRYNGEQYTLKLLSTVGDTIGASASANGAGNFPDFLVNTQFDNAGQHLAVMTIGPDIAIGNIFTIIVNGTPHAYEVIDIIEQSDGTQPGDTQEFSYIFKAQ
jgi:hypothetical protein